MFLPGHGRSMPLVVHLGRTFSHTFAGPLFQSTTALLTHPTSNGRLSLEAGDFLLGGKEEMEEREPKKKQANDQKELDK